MWIYVQRSINLYMVCVIDIDIGRTKTYLYGQILNNLLAAIWRHDQIIKALVLTLSYTQNTRQKVCFYMSYYIPGNTLGGAGKMKNILYYICIICICICIICLNPFPVLANMSFWYNGVGNLVKSCSTQLLILAPYYCRRK